MESAARRLALAAVASMVVHLLISAWRGPAPPEDEPAPPLQAELTRTAPAVPMLSPPDSRVDPPESRPRVKAKPPPRRTVRPRPNAAPATVPDAVAPEVVAPSAVVVPSGPFAPPELIASPERLPDEAQAPQSQEATAASPSQSPAPDTATGPHRSTVAGSGNGVAASAAEGSPSLPEPSSGVVMTPSTATPILTETLPPVVDLIYSAFLGSSTFVIGNVGYRFEHDGNRYAIETLGRAQGIVALLFPGQLRVRSSGRVTEKGLLPEELRVERGRADRVEFAYFDATSRTLNLHDKPPQPLNPPTYDLLTFWLQFYFAPPEGDEVQFRVATTRQVRDYRLRRTDNETVATPLGEVRTQVWRRVGEHADDADAVIWLAPLWNHLPVKVRLANRRGAVEQLLVGVRTGLEVPESMRAGPKLELPVDAEGSFVREDVPSERKHTP